MNIESGSPFFRHPCPGAKCACLDYEKEDRKKERKKKLEYLVGKESESRGEIEFSRSLVYAVLVCANMHLLDERCERIGCCHCSPRHQLARRRFGYARARDSQRKWQFHQLISEMIGIFSSPSSKSLLLLFEFVVFCLSCVTCVLAFLRWLFSFRKTKKKLFLHSHLSPLYEALPHRPICPNMSCSIFLPLL